MIMIRGHDLMDSCVLAGTSQTEDGKPNEGLENPHHLNDGYVDHLIQP